MLITAFNPETRDLEKTYSLNPVSAGVTSIAVKNSDRFNNNDRIMIGEMGMEKTEIVTVSATTPTSLTIGATQFAHESDTPIYVLRFDQVKFYRSTTGQDGPYAPLATVAMDVDNAELQTLYDDTSGLASYYYKVSFYHSLDSLESATSDPIQGGGYTRRQVGNIITEILQEGGGR